MTRIGAGTNLPTTDPLWTDQRLVDGKELTSDELKTSKEQTDAMSKTQDILGRTVRSGEWDKANERVSDLKKHFESLSPDTKKYLYGVLQTKNGMSEQFHYRLSDPSIEKLLKTLNPDHKADHVKKYTLNDAQAKASKNSEKNLEGQLNRASLNQAFDKAMGDPGFTPKVGIDKGLGDPGFAPKGVSDQPIGDPGFNPKLNPDLTPISELPIGDPGFIPKVGVHDKGFGDPGFTPKLIPDHSTEAHFPKDDPGFTPKGGSAKGPGDPGFVPNLKPDNEVPTGDSGFNPKLKK
jgi:SpoVK/Ycf46/Vps4 family AAA+-type ATPase